MTAKTPPLRKEAREAMIVFTVAGSKFAIAANAVREIRGTEELKRFAPGITPGRATKLEFTLHRGGTTYCVVNAARYFHLTGARPRRVLVLRKSAAAVLVDSTDRIIELTVLHALPQAFTADERTWYRGLALVNDEVLPVVDHTAFLSKAELSGFRTALEESRKAAV